MKLIVGLGNPGEKYASTRHNIGFVVLDELARRQIPNTKFQIANKFKSEIIQTKEYILVKPQTFMNDSGTAVAKICHFYKVKYEDLYVVHDDLDIQLGSYKIQHGKGPKVHHGISSVEEKLGTDKFWNVRIGVENRVVRGNKGVPGVVYSLQDFTSEERTIIQQVVNDVCSDLSSILQGPTL